MYGRVTTHGVVEYFGIARILREIIKYSETKLTNETVLFAIFSYTYQMLPDGVVLWTFLQQDYSL